MAYGCYSSILLFSSFSRSERGLYSYNVCVFFTSNRSLLPVDIQHTQCPCRFFLLLVERYKLCGRNTRKNCMYARVREFRTAQPPSTASPFGRINLEPSQATASKHWSPHSVRVRARVMVRVGWSASGTTAKNLYQVLINMYRYLVLYTWY